MILTSELAAVNREKKTLTTTIIDNTSIQYPMETVTQVIGVMDVNVQEVLDMVDQMADQSMKMTAIMMGATLAFTFIMEQAAYSTKKVRCCLVACVCHWSKCALIFPPLDLHF